MKPEEFILTSILNCDRNDLHLQKIELSSDQQNQYDSMMKRYDAGEPLQYVVGRAPFLDMDLRVNPSVLIPRPETEILVDHLISSFRVSRKRAEKAQRSLGSARDDKLNSRDDKLDSRDDKLDARDDIPFRILDIGTGSGAIGIALAKAFKYSEIVTMDVSMHALDVAKLNAREQGVFDRMVFICDSVLTTPLFKFEKYDLIVSNPPYIPTAQMEKLPNDVKQEPLIALDGGQDGLDFYRHIIEQAKLALNSGGTIAFELGDNQADDVSILMKAEGYSHIQFIEDYVGTKRHVTAKISSL